MARWDWGHLAKSASEEVSPRKLTMTKFEFLLFFHSGTCRTQDAFGVCKLQDFTRVAEEGTWVSISCIQGMGEQDGRRARRLAKEPGIGRGRKWQGWENHSWGWMLLDLPCLQCEGGKCFSEPPHLPSWTWGWAFAAEGKKIVSFSAFPQSRGKGHFGVRGLSRSSFFLEQHSSLFPASSCRQTACQASRPPQPYLSCAWQVWLESFFPLLSPPCQIAVATSHFSAA